MVILKEDYEPQFGIFHDLMKFRVREILLVSSFYDAFVLEEDGGLSERVFSEYIDLNLRFIPRITRVSSAEDAMEAFKKINFDLIITMTRISDMNLLEFGKKVKELKPNLPLILLTYEWVEIPMLIKLRETKGIDKVFYWTGDTRILLAIIKYIEDLKNLDNDISLGVRAILVIEDSPKFFSMFLPIIYTEIMTQTRMLISEGVNDLHRLLRMRARPKILLAETYEEGKKLYKKYKDNLLGVISDVRFPRKGAIDINAGFRFASRVKREIPDLPFLLQSSNLDNREIAYKKGLDFLHKNSENLLFDLQRFILSNFGFGDFVFKSTKGQEIGRARNLNEFEEMLQIIPRDSIELHSRRNHISIWLRARTEFEAAEKLRPMQISDFDNVDDMRAFIVREIQKLKVHNQSGVIADFGHSRLDIHNAFVRLGTGSLGGKARGLAFLNALLAKTKLADKFENVEICTPHTFVICSEVFEEFIQENDLQEFAIMESRNNLIAKRFMKAELPKRIAKDLQTLLEEITYPIAVRSSSLLEDSQMLPFAGLYSTFMLPNNHPNFKRRLKQLYDAVKLVFASVFYKSPKEYVRNTNFRIEEEKMAVIIQQIVGQEFDGKFYPVVSGTAQSYNFYPISHMEPEDGVVQLALGLGLVVAEGTQTFRVSPQFPEMNPPYSSAAEFLKKSQSFFYALDLVKENLRISKNEKFSLKKCELSEAERDGSIFFVASTFSSADNAIRDTISIPGPRVLTFANLLKYNIFPLSDILNEILKIGRESFGSHIEMEFAVNLFKDKSIKPQFYLLQIRPMVVGQEDGEVSLGDIEHDDIVCTSFHSMGNGIIEGIHDIVYVDPETFDISKSRVIAEEVGALNKKLANENRKYMLVGFGRWGTADPWLGIPVEWYQIANASLIIESNLNGFNVDPSQGSHFFHNLTSLRLGYFHIKKPNAKEYVNWQWLNEQKNLAKSGFVKHVRFKNPLIIKINGRVSQGVVLKPKE
jgi:CheY-like chemotaxis protein